MKVLLLDIDGKLPNIALHKLAAWHELQGDLIVWNLPLYLNQADHVYISTILTSSRPIVENLIGLRPDAIVGGTGTWGFIEPTPVLPAEVEAMKALINYGFTTRGCIRHCPFCLVHLIEGSIQVVGDIYDIWDRASETLTLFDNNILAVPDHFEKIIRQIAVENLIVDFNQGLDIRLLTQRAIENLKTVRLRQLRFAFDDPKLAGIVEEKVARIREAELRKQPIFYVLVGFDTTFQEDLDRLNFLRRLECRAFVMRYDKVRGNHLYSELASWANQRWMFGKYSFEEYEDLRSAR